MDIRPGPVAMFNMHARCHMHGLTRLLVAELLAGLGGPLAAEVLQPLGGRVGLIVEGEFGRVQPVGHVQEAAHAHHEAAS